MSFGFIITRHVNSSKTNMYWNQCVTLLRRLYPRNKIIIIDDNSNYDFVKANFNYQNVQIIQSEFHGRGELLPYYYYLNNKFFDNAVIIHDSVFFHKRVNFELLQNLKVLPLWYFNPDKENINNTKNIISKLNNSGILHSKIDVEQNIIQLPHDKWYGCFGCQSYINHDFLIKINQKYNIVNLIEHITNRPDRCCLERIMGCIFFTEYNKILEKKSLFGDIMKYQTYGFSFDNYVSNLREKKIPKYVVKVWTGR